jgi:tetratricopeptide (TPR) repeat protein
LTGHGSAQSSASKSPASRSHVQKKQNVGNAKPSKQDDNELGDRFSVARRALEQGNPDAIISANQRLIAVALRGLARLRVAQAAWPHAAELYRLSLALEENPKTRLDLAVVSLRLRRPSEAIYETEKVLFSYPQNARALHIEGEAYSMLAILVNKGPHSRQMHTL